MQAYYYLDDRQRCTVLAALAHYRDSTLAALPAIVDIATDGYTLTPHTSDDVAALIDALKECHSEQVSPEAAAYRDAAMQMTDDGVLEIDAGALVSMGEDPGAYVMAWVWVTNAAAGIEDEEGDEEEEADDA